MREDLANPATPLGCPSTQGFLNGDDSKSLNLERGTAKPVVVSSAIHFAIATSGDRANGGRCRTDPKRHPDAVLRAEI